MYKLQLFFILFICNLCWSQKNDSIEITNQFRSILTESNTEISKESIEKIKENYFKKSSLHKTWYWTELSKFYIQTGQLNEARSIVNEGLTFWSTKKNSSKTAIFYNLLGSIESLEKSYEKAIKAFQLAIEGYEKTNNKKAAAYVKNNIANIFFSLSDYESAYKYISEAYQVVKKEKDTLYLPSIAGVLAVSEVKLKKFESAKIHADESLELSKRYNSIIGIIIGNYTLGEYFTEKKDFKKAINYFQESHSLSTIYKQVFYIMLSDIGISHAANENKQFDLALKSGMEALQIAQQLKNQNTLYSIHQQLSKSYEGLNQTNFAYKHLKLAHSLFRTNADKNNRKIINDVLIKYETAKKEKEITEAKFNLQSEQLKSTQFMYLSAFLILLISISTLLIFNIKKLQNQKLKILESQKKESILKALVEGEERERERISHELHDGLASAITGVKLSLESTIKVDSVLQEKTVEQLKNLHEETRRISHNLMPLKLDQVSLIEALHRFCIDNTTEKTEIHFYADQNGKFAFTSNKAHILYRITQELIHNVLKHASAKHCSVQIQQTKETFSITIEDDGFGFSISETTKSQGLTSIENRLHEIGGKFHIESALGKGCFVLIELVL